MSDDASSQIVESLRGCLGTDEIRDCLDQAVPADGSVAWSVWFPDGSGDGFAPYLAGGGSSCDLASSGRKDESARALATIWDQSSPELELVNEGGTPIHRAGAPLTFRDERYGLLVVDGPPDLDLSIWNDIRDVLGPELVKVQLYETANRESITSGSKLEALHEAGQLVRELDLDVLLTKLMELSIKITHAEVGAVVLDRNGTWTTGIEWGLREGVVTSFRTRDGRPFLDAVSEAGETVFVEDAAESDWFDPSGVEVRLRSVLALPLQSTSKRLGVLVLVNSASGHLREEDSEVLGTIASLASIAIENAMLWHASMEHERISAEMRMATDIQDRFLPKVAPKLEGYDLAGWSRPCTETGGDYFDFLDLGEGRTGLVVADATGHGMGAALITFIVRASVRALLTRTQDLGEILATANDLLENDAEPGKFMTFFFGDLDRAARKLTWASAGHDPAMLDRPGVDEPIELLSTGMPLGVMEGSTFSEREIQLQPGDTILFGTDGIWEARNAAGEFYGKERLRAFLRSMRDEPLAEVSRRLDEDLVTFHAGAEPRDDITAVFLRVL